MASTPKAPLLRIGFTLPQSVVYFVARFFVRIWLLTQFVIFIIPAILRGVFSPETYEWMFREYIDLWDNYAVWAWNHLSCFEGSGWFAVFWENYVCWWLQPLPFYWPMYYDALPYIFVALAAVLIGLLSPVFWAFVGGWFDRIPRTDSARPNPRTSGGGGSAAAEEFNPDLFDDDDTRAHQSRTHDETMNKAIKTQKGRQGGQEPIMQTHQRLVRERQIKQQHHSHDSVSHGIQIMSRADALQILELKEPFTEDELKARWKEMLKRNHPDAGGSTMMTRLVNSAYEALLT